MTANELQDIVRLLANQTYTRYWLHFNYPQKEPWLMAISVRDPSRILDTEMQERGFSIDKNHFYVIERHGDI